MKNLSETFGTIGGSSTSCGNGGTSGGEQEEDEASDASDSLASPTVMPSWDPYEEKLSFYVHRSNQTTTTTTTIADTLDFGQLYIPDILTVVLSFLPWRDVMQYTTVNRAMYSVATSNAIWRPICARYIPGFHESSEEQIRDFMQVIVNQSVSSPQNRQHWSMALYLKKDMYLDNLDLECNMYHKYFVTGGIKYAHCVEFVVNKFLQCIRHEKITVNLRARAPRSTKMKDDEK